MVKSIVLIAFCASLAAVQARADVLFGDFNDAGGGVSLYNPTDGYLVLGTDVPGAPQTLAAQFQVPGSDSYAGTLLELGLVQTSGDATVNVSLWSDSEIGGDTPGAAPNQELSNWNVSLPTSDGSGNQIVTVDITGVTLNGGSDYWVEVAPGGDDTNALWGFNTVNDTDLTQNEFTDPHAEAYDASDIDVTPAFQIEGVQLVPEPASFTLFATALLGFAGMRLRRRRQ